MFVFVGWAIDYQTAMQTRCSGFALREPLCHPSLFHSSWINLLLCVCVYPFANLHILCIQIRAQPSLLYTCNVPLCVPV